MPSTRSALCLLKRHHATRWSWALRSQTQSVGNLRIEICNWLVGRGTTGPFNQLLCERRARLDYRSPGLPGSRLGLHTAGLTRRTKQILGSAGRLLRSECVNPAETRLGGSIGPNTRDPTVGLDSETVSANGYILAGVGKLTCERRDLSCRAKRHSAAGQHRPCVVSRVEFDLGKRGVRIRWARRESVQVEF